MKNNPSLVQSVQLLDSPDKLRNIGSAVVKEAIARAMIRKTKSGAARTGLQILKGEKVPESFKKAFNIRVDAHGAALENWPRLGAAQGDYFEVCYEDAGAGYCECWPDAPDFEQRITNISETRLQTLAGVAKDEIAKHFAPEEIKVLQAHGLVKI